MGIFRPTDLKENIFEITPEYIRSLGVRAVLLDVDNTIATYTSHEPIKGSIEWVASLKESGLKVMIVSNNFKKRVTSFAARFGLSCISFAIKPLPSGYIRAAGALGLKCSECVIIGDQIFTDVTGANMCGMKSILLSPIEPEDGFTFRVRRYFERPLRKKYTQKKK